MNDPYVVGSASHLLDKFMKPSRYKALFGGRGSAKSHAMAEFLIANAVANRGFRSLCIREIQKNLKQSAKRLLEDKIQAMGLGHLFRILNDCIKTPGNGVILFQGMQDHTAESIKSLENVQVAWVEEAQTLSMKSLEMLRPTIRAPGSELWFTWNPRSASDPVDKFFRGLKPPKNAIIAKINYDNNKYFPKELEEERLHDFVSYPDRYAHIWLGEYEPQAIGAIWSREIIHACRIDEMRVDRERTLIGIDPAISDTVTSDEHGIVCCALGSDKKGYVLEDASRSGSPHDWAMRAINLYDKYDADAIVIEINQGGDMCRHTLESVRRDVRIIEVRATRGKHVRAEPISALYATGKVHHVGSFLEIEDQLCKFTSWGWEGSKDKSPDRAEALIWCFSELFRELTTPKSKPESNFYPTQAAGWLG